MQHLKTCLLTACAAIATSFCHAQGWINVGTPGFSDSAVNFASMTIDRNGVPYVAYQEAGSGPVGPATAMKFNGTSWVNVGNPRFSVGGALCVSLTTDTGGTPYIAYVDLTNDDKVNVMKYNGSTWVSVGIPDFSHGIALNTAVAIDKNGIPYVGFQYAIPAVMKFNDTNWVNVDSADSAGMPIIIANSISIAIDSAASPYLAFTDQNNGNKASVIHYTGSAWAFLGSEDFSAGGADFLNIVIDSSGTPYIAYSDGTNDDKASVMKFNGTNWVYVGSPDFSAGEADGLTIVLVAGIPYVVYSDVPAGFKITVKKFNGTNWVTVGNTGVTVAAGGGAGMVVGPDEIPYIYFADNLHGQRITVMKMDTATAGIKNTSSPTSSLTIFPNPTHNTFTLNISTPQPETATITITNILGEKVKEFKATTSADTQVTLDAPAGIYFVTGVTSGSTQTEKVEVY